MSSMFQRSSFFRLPAEAQLNIAKSLAHSEGVSRIYRFLSPELYNFRLVCKSFAVLGAKALAWHAEIEPHSAYKSLLFDFTDRSLRLVFAIAKNKYLSSAIKSLYLILWRFKSVPFDQDAFAENEQVNVELATRWQQRQDFFRGDGLERLAILLQENFLSLSNVKWIENDLDRRFLGRRPLRYLSTTCQVQTSSTLENTFTNIFVSFAKLQKQVDSMAFLFENLTHLHLLRTTGQIPWDRASESWADMVLDAKNLICIRVEGEQNAECLSAILLRGRYPRLRKLVLRDVTCQGLYTFMNIHSAQLDINVTDDVLQEDVNEEAAAVMVEKQSTDDLMEPYFDEEDDIYRCSYCGWELIRSNHDEPTCHRCEEVFTVPHDFSLKNPDQSDTEDDDEAESEVDRHGSDASGDDTDVDSLIEFVDYNDYTESHALKEESSSSSSEADAAVIDLTKDEAEQNPADDFDEVDDFAEVDEFEHETTSTLISEHDELSRGSGDEDSNSDHGTDHQDWDDQSDNVSSVSQASNTAARHTPFEMRLNLFSSMSRGPSVEL